MDMDPSTRIPQAVKVLASIGSLILLVLQISLPSIPINTISLILLFLFILPWWIDSIDSLELPGVAKIRAKPALSSPTEEDVKIKLDQEVVDSLASAEHIAGLGESTIPTPESRESSARERYQILESSVLNALPSLGFESIKTEIAVDEQNGKRYLADAIALSASNATIVEITMPMVSAVARRKIGYLEKMVRLYSELQPNVRCRGLLVIGNTSEDRVKRLFGEVPPSRIDVALFDQQSLSFSFPYGRK
ncbi:MAG: hypothetical protein ACODUE_01860 [Synechococcus sp.]